MSPSNLPLSGSGQARLRLHVNGAAGAVSGSFNVFEYFSEGKVTRFILDVGLDQENEGRNFENRLPQGLKPADINFVIISHAHIDHSGYLPWLYKNGFKGIAYTHHATLDILKFLLPDSGYLQERAADRANRFGGKNGQMRSQGKRRRQPNRGQRQSQKAATTPTASKKFVPLYIQADAEKCLRCVQGINYDTEITPVEGISFRFTEAAHILGAAVVTLSIGKGGKKKTFCFTGNIGRPNTPILRNLAPVAQADYIMCESTYGNKLHEKRDRLAVLAGIINRAHQRALKKHPQFGYGVIVIPAFAVGRLQAVLYDLRQLMDEKRIPVIRVFLDSPMAIAATKVHRKYINLYNPPARKLADAHIDPFATPRFTQVADAQESMNLDGYATEPTVIIGSSGMASGGRILKHLELRLPGKQNTIVFVGYQGTGTFGKNLTENTSGSVMIHGKLVHINATIEFMSDYSGHADYNDILSWLGKFQRKPSRVFLVHGETQSLAALKGHIEHRLGWNVVIPKHRQCFDLI